MKRQQQFNSGRLSESVYRSWADDMSVRGFDEFKAMNEDGFGEMDFVRLKKGGDTYIYLFKLELENNDHRGYVLQVGKYPTEMVISEPKNSYAVVSGGALTEDEVEQAVVDDEKFEFQPGEIDISGHITERFLSMLEICLMDYVQELQPQVVRIYDELPSLVKDPEYTEKLDRAVSEWPGDWDLQQMEADRLNIITKIV